MKTNQKGFSLIELMIVVVIIGLLATVGVPQYQRFISKTKQAEAKSMMGGLYTAEKAFFAEWNRYYAEFRAVGYQPDGALTYNVGFQARGNGTVAQHPNAAFRAAASANYGTTRAACARAEFTCAQKAGTAAVNLRAANSTMNNAGTTFRLGAIGNIDADGTNDEWYVDQNKNFTVVNDDVYQ